MNVYYTNAQFSKLPYELQNEILSYLPPHPIKCILDECLIYYDYDTDFLMAGYSFFNLIEEINSRKKWEKEFPYEYDIWKKFHNHKNEMI